MDVLINNVSDSSLSVSISDLGTPVFDNITFPKGVYVDLNGNNQAYDEVKLDAVVFAINRPKEIIKSSVSGKNGSITEYIGHSDYVITVDAIITSKAASFTGLTGAIEPIELLERIKRIDDVPDRVEIRNKILQNVYGINYVIIANFSKSRIGPETWAIKLELEEDKDIDLGDFG